MSSKLIVITGPTAAGKTNLSIELAKSLKAEIFSADSRQFYRELNIGVAKPEPHELDAVPHHFINSHSVHEPLSAGAYEKEALALLRKYFEHREYGLLVGGSGLYIKAVCEGLHNFPDPDEEIRNSLNQQFEKEGIRSLVEELVKHDPERADSIDMQNPRRVIRALELWRTTGKTYADFINSQVKSRPFELLYFGLNWPRPVLYERINKRCELMLHQGLLNEVKQLQAYRHLGPLQTVGYREFFDYLDGAVSFQVAVEKFKQHSRNYAKRQLTWFNGIDGLRWLPAEERKEEVLKQLIKAISKVK